MGLRRAGAFADELARIKDDIQKRTIASVAEMRELRTYLARIPAEIAEKYQLSRSDYMDVYDAYLKEAYGLLHERWPDYFDATQPKIDYKSH